MTGDLPPLLLLLLPQKEQPKVGKWFPLMGRPLPRFLLQMAVENFPEISFPSTHTHIQVVQEPARSTITFHRMYTHYFVPLSGGQRNIASSRGNSVSRVLTGGKKKMSIKDITSKLSFIVSLPWMHLRARSPKNMGASSHILRNIWLAEAAAGPWLLCLTGK